MCAPRCAVGNPKPCSSPSIASWAGPSTSVMTILARSASTSRRRGDAWRARPARIAPGSGLRGIEPQEVVIDKVCDSVGKQRRPDHIRQEMRARGHAPETGQRTSREAHGQRHRRPARSTPEGPPADPVEKPHGAMPTGKGSASLSSYEGRWHVVHRAPELDQVEAAARKRERGQQGRSEETRALHMPSNDHRRCKRPLCASRCTHYAAMP